MDWSLPGSSIHGIFQARVLETELPRKPQKKTWYMYTVEYYLAIKKNKIMPFAATWMQLEIIISSEVNQTEKDKYHVISFICGT